ncbi:hypothetical protein [Streptomyces sp. NPDC093071]|uniref:hypothetical protein n=1 Tax=Streptomyces sp. NPDC093071 TaxID=3366022 RepID=UPI0037FF80F9
MTSRFQQAGRTLSLLGPLRWLRLSGDRHPLHGHQQVSFLGWRFEEPDAEKLRVVEEAVRTTPTREEWAIDTSRRNRLLVPSRLLGEGENPAASPDFDERVTLAVRDQDFCVRTLLDMDAMLETLYGLATTPSPAPVRTPTGRTDELDLAPRPAVRPHDDP